MDNICCELDENKLVKIGQDVREGFEADLKSSQEWLEDVKKVEELVSLVSKKKTKPLPNSANIKYPLITKACYEFSSRTYPELIRDGKVAKGAIIGKDHEVDENGEGKKFAQAQRVSAYLNYQLLYADNNWELELDRLLNQLALVGFICKKSYYDPIRRKVRSEICEYKDLIINSATTSLEDAPRISHVIRVRLRDLIEAQRSEIFNDKPIEELIARCEADNLDPEIELIEQHTFCDLDDDKYPEPYIVTILKETNQVLRIAPRFKSKAIKSKNGKVIYIDPKHFFTDYHFLVSPKGKFQSVGFGILMLHLNEAINTMMNQLTDAGQLANMQTGFIDARLQQVDGDGNDLMPGEWRLLKGNSVTSIKDGVFPIQYHEPSSVLFQMLGLLIESAKELSSSTEAMTGAGSPENVKSGAVMAMIDQSLKLFTSIQRRVYRSIGSELRKIYLLDGEYLNPEDYINVIDDELGVFAKDFDPSRVDVLPVADPNLSSESQRIARYQILFQMIGLPGVKPDKITKRLVEALNLPNTQELLVTEEEKKNAPPPLEVIQMQQEMEGHAQELELKAKEVDIKERELKLKEQQLQFEIISKKAEIAKTQSEIILNIAKAEAAEAGTQLQDYQQQADMMMQQLDHVMQQEQMDHDRQMQQAEIQKKQLEVQAKQQQNQQQSQASTGA